MLELTKVDLDSCLFEFPHIRSTLVGISKERLDADRLGNLLPEEDREDPGDHGLTMGYGATLYIMIGVDLRIFNKLAALG